MILNLAKVMNLFESAFVLQNDAVLDTANVLETYIGNQNCPEQSRIFENLHISFNAKSFRPHFHTICNTLPCAERLQFGVDEELL